MQKKTSLLRWLLLLSIGGQKSSTDNKYTDANTYTRILDEDARAKLHEYCTLTNSGKAAFRLAS